MSEITQDYLHKMYAYDPKTGVLTHKVCRSNRVKVGDVAGCKNAIGYIVVGIKGKLYAAHRIIWMYVHGTWPKYQIDHINHNKTDNRICNLRDVTHRENQLNYGLKASNSSGVVGVGKVYESEKWRARIKIHGKEIGLGVFDDKFDAICARKSAENIYGFHENYGATL